MTRFLFDLFWSTFYLIFSIFMYDLSRYYKLINYTLISLNCGLNIDYKDFIPKKKIDYKDIVDVNMCIFLVLKVQII